MLWIVLILIFKVKIMNIDNYVEIDINNVCNGKAVCDSCDQQ